MGFYLHLYKHEWIVTDSHGLAAGSGHLLEQDFPGSDVGELFLVGSVGELWIEICENCWSLVSLRMTGVVDVQIFNADPFRHVTGIAEIMVTGIGTTNQAGTDWVATSRYKHTVADNKFSLPGTAIIAAQIDEVPAVDGGIFYR